MKDCLFCGNPLSERRSNTLYCNAVCRVNANRSKNKALDTPNEVQYLITSKGVKIRVTKEVIFDLIERMGWGEQALSEKKHFETQSTLKNKVELRPDTPPNINIPIDYKKKLINCEFGSEYEALWEEIKADVNLTSNEKAVWKSTLNAK